ncbi:MAG: HAD family phosphatase [Syntrophorhabdales bacterium]|jgi:HAD superfamily hydrolase (TIGR01509 family)
MKRENSRIATRKTPAFLFDLDGTLVDSVYHHVMAWREAVDKMGLEVSNWRIHRQMGMGDRLIVHTFERETGHCLTSEEEDHLRNLHTEAYLKRAPEVRPLPGALDLLSCLSSLSVPWTIATSSSFERARASLEMLGIGSDIPVVTGDQVSEGKPDPGLFLMAVRQLGVPVGTCMIVGDAVWDLLAARRAGALGIGMLSGGYGEDELFRAGAYRVYEDPADLLRHLYEVGVHGRDSAGVKKPLSKTAHMSHEGS